MPDYAEIQYIQSATRSLSRLSSYDLSSGGVVAPESFPTLVDLDELLPRFRELYEAFDEMEGCGWLDDGAVDVLVMGDTGAAEKRAIGKDVFGEVARFEGDWLGGVVGNIGAEGLQAWAKRVDEILGFIDARLVVDPPPPPLLSYSTPNYNILTWKMQRLHFVLAAALVSYSTSHAGDFDIAVFERPVRYFKMAPALTFRRRDVGSEFGPLWVMAGVGLAWVDMAFEGFGDGNGAEDEDEDDEMDVDKESGNGVPEKQDDT